MDERKESGEFYPGGRETHGGGGQGGGGDTVPRVPVTQVEELPERYRESDMRSKVNQLCRIVSGGVAALALMVAAGIRGAEAANQDGVTVQGARKDALYNDDFVVTNVTVALDGLVTTNQLEEVRRSDGEELLQEIAGATNAVTAELIGEIAGATNAVTAELIGEIAGATNAVTGERAAALAPYATKDWVNEQGFAGGSALEGYATQGWVTEQGYAPKSWVESRGYMTGTNLAPYATRDWVDGRGYMTGTNLAPYATRDWVEGKGYLTPGALEDYATQDWVEGKGYLTQISLLGYATQDWVGNQGYMTQNEAMGWIGAEVREEVQERVSEVVYERDVARRLEDMEEVPGQTNGWRWGYWMTGDRKLHNVNGVYEGTNIVGLATNEVLLATTEELYESMSNVQTEAVNIASNAYDTATNAYSIASNAYDTATNSYAIASNALKTNEAISGFTEWRFTGADSDFVFSQPFWVQAETKWGISFTYMGSVLGPYYSNGGTPQDVQVEISLDTFGSVTATRVRLPTMADITNITTQLDGKANTNDVQLTPVYSDTPTYPWILDPPTYCGERLRVEHLGYGWKLYVQDYQIGFCMGSADATSLLFHGSADWAGSVDLTATRGHRTDIIGYTLGTQTNDVLAATNALISASITNGLLSAESDPVWDAAKGEYAKTGTVAQVSEAVGTLWSYVYGDSVWIAVTNYMRRIGGVSPSFQLWEVRDGVTNLVYWSKEEITNVTHDLIHDCKTNLEQTVRNAVAEMPDKAWSKYQSATGNEAPEGVTIVSTPTIQLTGGGEWYRYIDISSNSVWFLKSNGLHTFGGDTNGYFRILDDEGNATFEVRKTDSYLVDAVPSSVQFDASGNFCVSFESNVQPVIYTSASLDNPNFLPEGEDPNVTVTWTQSGGVYTATLEQAVKGPSLFAYAKVEVQGETVIRNSVPTDIQGGIIVNGVKYNVGTATINGNTVLTLTPRN